MAFILTYDGYQEAMARGSLEPPRVLAPLRVDLRKFEAIGSASTPPPKKI